MNRRWKKTEKDHLLLDDIITLSVNVDYNPPPLDCALVLT